MGPEYLPKSSTKSSNRSFQRNTQRMERGSVYLRCCGSSQVTKESLPFQVSRERGRSLRGSWDKSQQAMMHQSKTVIRILLVDDHQIFLTGLQLLIEKEPDMTVVGTAGNRTGALAMMQEQPDIVLLDLDLGNESGIDFLPQL